MGGLVEGSIQKVDKNGSDVELLENTKVIAPQGIKWHVFASFYETAKLLRFKMYTRVSSPQGIQWHVLAAFRPSDKLFRFNTSEKFFYPIH